MTRSIRFLLPDQTAQSSLALPDLIQDASARNPALVTTRKQWEAATNRIAQARSLEDPTLSVQLWNFLQARWEVALLYRTTVLPQAEQGVEAARVGYRTGRTPFFDLIDADRALREFQLAYWRALIESPA